MRIDRTPLGRLCLLVALLVSPLAADPLGAQVINEIRIDQPGSDNDEYFELFGPAGTSLNGLTYLVIGDSSAGSGSIEAVVNLAGQSIPGSGFFVAAESTFTLTNPNLTTSLNFENSDNVTHLLVEGFTGANGDDLDTNDDGVLDVTPWTSILDSVSLVETTNVPADGEWYYGASQVGPDGVFVPAHSYRFPDGTGAFEIGIFDVAVASDTPGGPNAAPLTEDCGNGLDDDGDGLADCADDDCACDAACNPVPANDDCANAQVVGEGTFTFTTTGASDDGPTTCGGVLSRDVWFSFTAPCTGLTTFTTCGTASVGFNPQMAIYDGTGGCTPSGSTWIACDAGSCIGSGEPEIILDVVAGQTYLVQLGGFLDSCGTGDLTITCPSPDCHVAPNPNYTETYAGAAAFTNAPAADITQSPVLFDFVTVSGVGTITDVDVQVNCTHPFVGDLIVDIFSPANTSVRVHSAGNVGGSGNMDVRFDDESANGYDTVSLSDGLSCQPFSPLSLFDGESADGPWGITLQDDFLVPGDPARGTLDAWSVIFPAADAIPDNLAGGIDAQIDFPPTNLDGVGDLDIELDITHPATGDLLVSLSSPSGTTVTLHDQTAGVDILGRYDDATGNNDGYGNLVPDGPGTLADFDGQLVGGSWTLNVQDLVPGTTGALNSWSMLVCPQSCAPVTGLAGTSDCAVGAVTLDWLNGETYSSIEVLRDGVLLATIGGTDTTYTDTAPLEGFHEYEVRGSCPAGGAGQDSRFVNHIGYAGETTIVLQLEGLVDLGDPGAIDSGAAIEAALLANGLTSVKRISINPLDYPCLLDPAITSVWIAAGTYPNNYLLTTAQGDLIASMSQAGVAIYLESADHWGFSHDISALDLRDGVDDLIHNDDIADGDDSFAGMDGLDSGNGLDCSAYSNVVYTQESTLILGEQTDQFAIATTDPEVTSAGAMWALDDALGTPYFTGLFTDTTTGGDLVLQSWELGGFNGDQTAIVGLYLDALGLGSGPTGGFDRGDCNADAALNIADAVFVLSALFSGGASGPCLDACDGNDDGSINIADAVYLLSTLFTGGASPPAPHGACGADPSADALDCASFPPCP
ncbi:MAG: proprotein convertase P-domain-containing protein [Planctomycetota bacterium]